MGEFPNKDTQFQPGQSGNPAGAKKGTKHLSTWIQEILNDENFETILIDSKKGAVEYKGAPIKAIVGVAVHRAIHDKEKGQQWAEWLAKHGYGNTLNLNTENPINIILSKYGLGNARQTSETEERSFKDNT